MQQFSLRVAHLVLVEVLGILEEMYLKIVPGSTPQPLLQRD